MNFWEFDLEDLKQELNTDFDFGLNSEEVKKRIEKYGLNKLPEEKKESFLKIFFDQFKSPLIYILLIASVIVYLIGDLKDSLIILFVLIFNAFIGSFEEIKAQNALLALKKFVQTKTTVLREGKEIIIDSSELVPGDIVFIKEGEKIPADARIIKSNNLKVNEASLTGESIPVHKSEKVIHKKELAIQERNNMVFMGTAVVFGNAKVCVVATGINSFIGQISQKILHIDTEIPLKKDLRYFSRILVLIILFSILILFNLGIYFGKSIKEMFAISVALAVSMIPEGLPVLFTIVLAKGVLDMAQKNALVKKLQAVESLGQVKVIAVDKTGTLTRNELIIRKIFINNRVFDVSGVGYESNGFITLESKKINLNENAEVLLAGKIAIFSGDAILKFNEQDKVWQVFGDPTEAAMIVFGEKIGFKKDEIENKNPKLIEEPFDYQKKYHLVLRKFKDKENFLSITGAPEVILELCSKIYLNGKNYKLDKNIKEDLRKKFENFSEQGFRVIAFGYKTTKNENLDLKDLIFCGFYLIEDSLRPEIKEAISKIKAAGIKIVMITGDHKLTAIAIAREAGILDKNFRVLTGKEIDEMSDDALFQMVKEVSIFSRVTPDHKLKIIEAYRKNGITIAMTGDGVNDVPPLLAADLGVAMGKIGTEVTKESADIVLLDDNFGTIVDAIFEGRMIYKNIQKIILLLVSTSFGELLSITAGVLLGFPQIILPAQILWLNLVTDPFMGFGLAFEKEDENILKNKFKRSRYLIDKLMALRIGLVGLVMMLGTIYAFTLFYNFSLLKAQTMALLVLSIFQWFNAFNCKSENKSVFKNIFSNKNLIFSLMIVLILQIAAIYLPFMQKILNTTPLSLFDWIFGVTISFSIILIEELRKFAFRLFKINF
jgi:Ca2+-transporting ATPase